MSDQASKNLGSCFCVISLRGQFMYRFVLLFGLAFCTTLFAAAGPAKLSLDDINPTEVVVLVNQFKAQGEKFSPGPKRRQFMLDAEKLLQRLNVLQDWTVLDVKEKIVIVNGYESLRAQVGDASARRNAIRCRSTVRAGTHLGSTRCRSQADSDLDQDQAEHDMRALQRTDFPPQGHN
jgi:hypothetical protein